MGTASVVLKDESRGARSSSDQKDIPDVVEAMVLEMADARIEPLQGVPATKDDGALRLAECVQKTVSVVNCALGTLKGVDLIGDGANAFSEMALKVAFLTALSALRDGYPGLALHNEYSLGTAGRVDIHLEYCGAHALLELKYIRTGFLRGAESLPPNVSATWYKNANLLLAAADRINALTEQEVLTNVQYQTVSSAGKFRLTTIGAELKQWRVQANRYHKKLQESATNVITFIVVGVASRVILVA